MENPILYIDLFGLNEVPNEILKNYIMKNNLFEDKIDTRSHLKNNTKPNEANPQSTDKTDSLIMEQPSIQNPIVATKPEFQETVDIVMQSINKEIDMQNHFSNARNINNTERWLASAAEISGGFISATGPDGLPIHGGISYVSFMNMDTGKSFDATYSFYTLQAAGAMIGVDFGVTGSSMDNNNIPAGYSKEEIASTYNGITYGTSINASYGIVGFGGGGLSGTGGWNGVSFSLSLSVGFSLLQSVTNYSLIGIGKEYYQEPIYNGKYLRAYNCEQ